MGGDGPGPGPGSSPGGGPAEPGLQLAAPGGKGKRGRGPGGGGGRCVAHVDLDACESLTFSSSSRETRVVGEPPHRRTDRRSVGSLRAGRGAAGPLAAGPAGGGGAVQPAGAGRERRGRDHGEAAGRGPARQPLERRPHRRLVRGPGPRREAQHAGRPGPGAVPGAPARAGAHGLRQVGHADLPRRGGRGRRRAGPGGGRPGEGQCRRGVLGPHRRGRSAAGGRGLRGDSGGGRGQPRRRVRRRRRRGAAHPGGPAPGPPQEPGRRFGRGSGGGRRSGRRGGGRSGRGHPLGLVGEARGLLLGGRPAAGGGGRPHRPRPAGGDGRAGLHLLGGGLRQQADGQAVLGDAQGENPIPSRRQARAPSLWRGEFPPKLRRGSSPGDGGG